MRVSKRTGKRVVRKRPYRKRATTKVSKNVKKYIKRAIHSQVENKVLNINSGDNFGNHLNNVLMGSYPMMPLGGFWTIPQNVTSAGRVGNVIKVRKVTLNYVLRPLIYNLTTNPNPIPCEIDLFLGYVKRRPADQIQSGDINNLFQNGSSVLAPAGNLNDLISDINKDYWVIKKRWRHKIGLSNYSGSGSTTPGTTQFQFYSNNDFKLNAVRKMDITRHLPVKTITFNDSDGTSQKNLFFFYQAIAADGQTMPASQETMKIDFWVKFEYEDA